MKRNEGIFNFEFSILFFVEHQAQPEVYDNGWRSVVWAFMQYIGDPGGFADTLPVTFRGRLIAVLVGVPGIAIFAVPAGLTGSGFIETIEATRREEEYAHRQRDTGGCALVGRCALPRAALLRRGRRRGPVFQLPTMPT